MNDFILIALEVKRSWKQQAKFDLLVDHICELEIEDEYFQFYQFDFDEKNYVGIRVTKELTIAPPLVSLSCYYWREDL